MSKAPNFKNFKPSSEKASRALSKIKATDTKGEKLLRSGLWRMGFRFRKNVRDLPGKPDIVFLRHKVVIFCDGDFWHGRRWRKDKRRLQAGPNAPYWIAKIQANINRDKRYNKELKRLGWHVVRLWESDIRANAEKAATSIAKILAKTVQLH